MDALPAATNARDYMIHPTSNTTTLCYSLGLLVPLGPGPPNMWPPLQ
jgi:hypothetical protein